MRRDDGEVGCLEFTLMYFFFLLPLRLLLLLFFDGGVAEILCSFHFFSSLLYRVAVATADDVDS